MKLVPLKKQSKRAQREHYDRQRISWNGVVPVTKVIPNKRAYDRERMKRADRNPRAEGNPLEF